MPMQMKPKNTVSRRRAWSLLLYGAAGLSAAFLFILYIALAEGSGDLSSERLRALCTGKFFLLLAFGCTAAALLFGLFREKFTDLLFRYRFALAAALFLSCVALGINGSSLGCWQRYFGDGNERELLGTVRLIRSDEWALFTPMGLSQYGNPSGSFNYFSELLRGTETDMFLLYGQPVYDIAVIFRPFQWGYLFLPEAQGLSWFWAGRGIALALVSFEFGRLITGDRRLFALAYAALVVWSPTVAWWFSINGLVEMLIAAQASILLFRRYLETENCGSRALFAALILLAAGSFVLTMYPAWMVPVAYIILGLILWTLLDFRGRISFRRRDIAVLLCEVLIFGALMAHVFLKSKDTLSALMNTYYPGKRVELGGGFGGFIGTYLASFWFAVMKESPDFDPCIGAQFLSFFPLPWILTLRVLLKEKKRDPFLLVMLPVSLFLSLFAVVRFPAFLAKLTLLSYSQGLRILNVIGFLNLMLLFRSLTLSERPVRGRLSAAVGFTAAAALSAFCYYLCEKGYLTLGTAAGSAVIFGGAMALIGLVPGRPKLRLPAAALLIALSVFAGGLVNPVTRGTAGVTETALVQEIRRVEATDPGSLWAVDASDYPVINATLLAGVRGFNSTNIYPDAERWEILDPEGENEAVWNRYAHILLTVKAEGEPEYELLGADHFSLTVSSEDVRRLGIRYLISKRDLAAEPGLGFERVGEGSGYGIYRVGQD